MSNLGAKYKILEKVKILQQKHKAKGMTVNQKSGTLSQCLKIFNQKHLVVLFMYVLSVCRHGLEHLFMMLQI